MTLCVSARTQVTCERKERGSQCSHLVGHRSDCSHLGVLIGQSEDRRGIDARGKLEQRLALGEEPLGRRVGRRLLEGTCTSGRIRREDLNKVGAIKQLVQRLRRRLELFELQQLLTQLELLEIPESPRLLAT